MSDVNAALFVALGDVASEPIEQTGPTGDFTYVDISSIDRESKKIVGAKIIPTAEAPSRARQVLRPGDVLVSMTRPNLNAVSIVPDNLNGAIASTGFHVLRSKWIEPKFLFNLVQTDEFIDSMCDVVQGALYPAVRPKDIASFTFTLPSLNQQIRIVEKLEELLSDLDAGVAELKAAQAKLVRYRQSLLKAAVEGALTAEWRQHNIPEKTGAQLLQRILTERRARWETKQLIKFTEQGRAPPKDWQKKYPEPVQPDTRDLPELPVGWVWASLDQLSLMVRNGLSQKPSPERIGIPILRINAVRPMAVNLDEVRYLPLTEIEANDYLLDEGDLLATRYNGSVDLLGVFGVVRGIKTPTVHPDKLIRIKPVFANELADWIEICSCVGASRKHLVSRVKTTAGQTGISGEDVKKMPIPLAPYVEQAGSIKCVAKALLEVKAQSIAIEASLKQSTAQRKNILRAAFSGQLVPQNPNDEPASALLARIRAGRATDASTTLRRRKRTDAGE